MDLTCKTDGCDEEAVCAVCMQCNTHHTKGDREVKEAALLTALPLLATPKAVAELAALADDEIGLIISYLMKQSQ